MPRPEDKFRDLESLRVKLMTARDLVRAARSKRAYDLVGDEWFDKTETTLTRVIDFAFQAAYKGK